MNPSFVRREVEMMIPIWQQIRDCIEGETAIKGPYHPGRLPHQTMGGSYTTTGMDGITVTGDLNYVKRYLPMPNPDDSSKENLERYKAYVSRAQFYPVTSRTLDGLTGQVFQRDPEITLPDEMKVMETDADGTGLDLTQLSQESVRNVLAYGRGGLFTDYPPVEGGATKAQIADGEVKPTIVFYEPWNIINWSIVKRGAKRLLSLVVLREVVNEVGEDQFSLVEVIQYRVLRLVNDVYTVELWREDTVNKTGFAINEVIKPTDADGNTLDEIQFDFIGAVTNDWRVDKPPMADIASLNVGHYRNSADYEESCFIAGQPTPVFSGLEQSWVDKNFADKTIMLGSRRAIPLGKEAKAELLQATENGMPMEAMKHKEEQMLAIGAKLITANKTTRTATETTVQQSSENSTLGNIAVNVGKALQNALIRCAQFMGVDIGENTPIETTQDAEGTSNFGATTAQPIRVMLNSDFDINKKSPQEIVQIIAAWQAGVTSWTECRISLRAAGYTSLPDQQAMEEIQKEKAAAFQLGGHPIADPFGLPPGVTPPQPVNQEAQQAQSEAAKANNNNNNSNNNNNNNKNKNPPNKTGKQN